MTFAWDSDFMYGWKDGNPSLWGRFFLNFWILIYWLTIFCKWPGFRCLNKPVTINKLWESSVTILSTFLYLLSSSFFRWVTVGCTRGCGDEQPITLDDRISIDTNGKKKCNRRRKCIECKLCTVVDRLVDNMDINAALWPWYNH